MNNQINGIISEQRHHIEFKSIDKRGRKLGILIIKSEVKSEAQRFCAYLKPTRNGRMFGSSSKRKMFACESECDEWIVDRASAAKKLADARSAY
jgi:hypothetical protein